MNKLPLFSLLTPWSSEQQKQFITGLKHKSVPDGAVIFERGDTDSDVYFIISGVVKSVNFGNDGNISYFRPRYAGDCFGYYSAISESPRTVTVTAVGPTVLAKISGTEFFSLVLENRNITRNFLKLVVGLLRVETDRLTNMTTLPTRKRVAAELLAHTGGQQRVRIKLPDRNELASYLGMTRETLSRALNYLDKKKFIKVNKNEILILDSDSLKAFIEV